MTTRKPTAKKNPGGRPRHAPTDAGRTKVKVMVTAGLRQDVIGKVMGIDKKTLQKHYRDELDSGRAEALTNNTARLINAANTGNTAAMIYLQKCIGGTEWRDNRHEVSHAGAVTISVKRLTPADIGVPDVPLEEVTESCAD